ncbi:MAG: GerW family sporulation protein [Eubacteriales bacterium]
MENKLSDIIKTSLESIRDLVDVNTVIGDPIKTDSGTTIIPVSKVSMGFASGGVDYFSKQKEGESSAAKQPGFGGGGGTGVSVSPLGFLVIKPDGNVDLLNITMPQTNDTIETIGSLIDKAPDVISRLKAIFSGDKKTDADKDDESEYTRTETTVETDGGETKTTETVVTENKKQN